MIKLRKMIDLYLFDGAAGAAAGGAEGSAAGESQIAAGKADEKKVVYGKTEETKQEPQQTESQTGSATGAEGSEDRDYHQEFDELIHGDYKDAYETRIKATMDKRFKAAKQTEETLNAVNDAVLPLYMKYDIDPGDAQALAEAIKNDDKLYEEAAYAEGMDVDQYKQMKDLQVQNRKMAEAQARQQAEAESAQLYQSWLAEADELKEIYPGFDIEAESENPMFVNLISNDVPLRKAYEAIHMDEIMKNTATEVGDAVRKKTADTIRANGQRPAEGGITEQPGIIHKTDPKKFTMDDFKDIEKRVRHGEKISF